MKMKHPIDISVNGNPIWWDGERCWIVGNLDVDTDGGPNVDDDRFWQPDTTLHHLGKPINTQIVSGIVVPPSIIKGVGRPIVMGCQARVSDLSKVIMAQVSSLSAAAFFPFVAGVVFDVGPTKKDGEGSAELCGRLGYSRNSNTGGCDLPVILYELWPDVPAVVDGIQYDLQPAR